MANPSYCRFENTLRDLQDCHVALQEGASEDENKELSEYERDAIFELIELCGRIYHEYAENQTCENSEGMDY